MENLKFYNAFNQIPQVGSVRFSKLLSYFPDLEQAWCAPLSELLAAGIEQPIAEILAIKRAQIDVDGEMEKIARFGVQIIIETDPNYPPLLKQIHNPPALLYVRGDPKTLASEFSLAVVGTRRISAYGKQVVPHLIRDLAASGISIVSGLALGVDELAHRSALDANGKTVAVLGCGIDDGSIYPSSNRVIAQRIANGGGAVISELPLGAAPLKMHFPHRNRIISGMSLGTLVVEADLGSGSLITARLALEQNRQVFAVPGHIFNQYSAGPNNLLKLGAKAVTAASDITEELNLNLVTEQLAAREVIPSTPTEEKLLNILSNEPQHIDLLIKGSGLPASDVSAALTMMEIKGKVRNLGAMQYVKAR
ncbi:MAG: DNA-processing protein DprA [Patescibacteria group bacterium]|nr:DNA-processing protein DprA [Patescibacteria group bacterium]